MTETRAALVDPAIVDRHIEAMGIADLGKASIREIKKITDEIEKESGVEFVRMEMGIPGLPAVPIGVEAQVNALRDGVASLYPDIQGIPQLKREISRFVRNFLDIDVSADHCLPTVGSMMGSLVAMLTVNRMHADREGTLFIDPGFPVHKQQCRLLGHDFMSFDVYDYRGHALRDKLESLLKSGKVSSILYSNPNNPAWICFTEEELRTIGELAKAYDVVVIEDLAYFGMDFRRDYSRPGEPPFQPTVARYTDNYMLLISSSKAFSYAGERIGMLVVGDALWMRREPDLKRYFTSDQLGHAILFGTMYAITAGTSHSAQHGLAAILKAVNDGDYNFVDAVSEYGEKARIMKRAFTENGFYLVYDRDLDEPVGDGFYFTFAYPGMSGGELLRRLMCYGISGITLGITGSTRTEGIRACTSLVRRDQLPELEERVKRFHRDRSQRT
ncbi:MAG: pyridoxal phosphate-dependent aminotransferase [Acidobacteriota bacterium]|jgi:aspartate/methionine/tyrosine aminotransferase|nr:pyridoxal phosphate-dependent aminotransferase [Acidobacteriota bacterium]